MDWFLILYKSSTCKGVSIQHCRWNDAWFVKNSLRGYDHRTGFWLTTFFMYNLRWNSISKIFPCASMHCFIFSESSTCVFYTQFSMKQCSISKSFPCGAMATAGALLCTGFDFIKIPPAGPPQGHFQYMFWWNNARLLNSSPVGIATAGALLCTKLFIFIKRLPAGFPQGRFHT